MRGTISKKGTGSAGFTMVEALISVAILAVVALALTKLFYLNIAGNQEANTYTLMVTVARDRLERIKVQALNSDEVTFGAIANEGPTTVNAQGLPDPAGKFSRRVVVTNVDIGVGGNVDYKVVDVIVSAVSPLRAATAPGAAPYTMTVTLSTMVTPKY